MKAAVLEAPGKLVLKDVPIPVPGPGEALVRVKACGVCLTDYLGYVGRRDNVPFPAIPGHEISGVIAQAGPGVSKVKEGDEVVVNPVVSCGYCDNCRKGLEHYCRNGAVIGGDGQPTILDGGMAEYVLVPEKSLFLKPPGVSFRSACLAEPLAGSYKGLIESSRLKMGEDVVIIGVGAMGLLVAMLAVRAGAGTVVVVDKNDFRLERALELGCHQAINPDKEKVGERLGEILPAGPDLIFESAGTLPAAELAFSLARRGTRINMFGVIVPGTIPVSPRDIHFLETRVDASFSVTSKVMFSSIHLMSRNIVDPGRIITHVFSLGEVEKAFSTMESPDRIKVVVEP